MSRGNLLSHGSFTFNNGFSGTGHCLTLALTPSFSIHGIVPAWIMGLRVISKTNSGVALRNLGAFLRLNFLI